jgi:hypothetical protein
MSLNLSGAEGSLDIVGLEQPLSRKAGVMLSAFTLRFDAGNAVAAIR